MITMAQRPEHKEKLDSRDTRLKGKSRHYISAHRLNIGNNFFSEQAIIIKESSRKDKETVIAC